MEVEIGGEGLDRELVDGVSVCGRDMGVTEVFADDGAVFAFDERIVVGLPGSGLGELDVELGEQGGDLMVDVL